MVISDLPPEPLDLSDSRGFTLGLEALHEIAAADTTDRIVLLEVRLDPLEPIGMRSRIVVRQCDDIGVSGIEPRV